MTKYFQQHRHEIKIRHSDDTTHVAVNTYRFNPRNRSCDDVLAFLVFDAIGACVGFPEGELVGVMEGCCLNMWVKSVYI